MDELDIWRAAGTLVKRYGGERAALMAAMRADKLLNQGNVAACNAWKRIVKAINELERTRPGDEEPLN